MLRIRSFALSALALALATALLSSCSPASPDFRDPRTGTPKSLGELVYQILLANLQESPTCPETYVAQLTAHHEDFVTTFDYLVDGEVVQELPEILGEVLQPVIDSGDLPRMTDAVARALALLISDEFDPERLTIQSAMSLQDTRTVLEGSMAIELVSRLLADPELTARIHDLAEFAAHDDGIDYTLDALLYIAERRLADTSDDTSMCQGLTIGPLEDTLLTQQGFTFGPGTGAAAWVPRVDAHGNPRVREMGGALLGPFVDLDHDGDADVNAEGEPIDASGTPIDLPALANAAGAGRDSYGRAIDADGELIYEYYDAKRTGLAAAVQIARGLLEADLHHDLNGVAAAVLGGQVPCSDGTDTCRAYPSADNPLADIAFMVTEIAKLDRPKALLDTLSVLVTDNPVLAEDLFVAVGDLIHRVDTQTSISITDPALIDLGMELVPLIEDVLDSSNTSGQSTARVLLDVLVEVRAEQPDFLERVAWMIDYIDLDKSNTCSAQDPNLATSRRVDYDQPRWTGAVNTGTDNRSILEQVVELLYTADCGNLFGGTVAYQILDLLVAQDPSTVCQVINVLGVIDGVFANSCEFQWWNPLSWIQCVANAVANGALNAIGCSNGQAVLNELESLQGLAESGSLDALIPLAKLFDDRGQLRLLVNLLKFLHEETLLDEDNDPNTESVIRQLLPVISEFIHSGGADKLLDTLELMVTVPASDNPSQTMADVVVDTLERVTETRVVQTRSGGRPSTSMLRETMLPLRVMVNRINQRGAKPELDHMLDYVLSGITTTRMEGPRRRLNNPNLLPLMQVGLEVVRDAADLPHAQYLCYVGEAQSSAVNLLLDRDFATVVRLASSLESTEEGPRLEAWVTELLTPSLSSPDTEAYGPLMQILAAALSSELPDSDLSALFRYVGTVSGQLRNDGRDFVGTLDELLAGDRDGVILRIVRDAISEGPLPSRELPICTMADVFSDVATVTDEPMCMAGGEVEFTATDVESVLEGVVGFMDDDTGGLGAVYRLVGELSSVQN
ncbi:MAG: hypothetical protein H6726_29305 [Sandaracinaceae bacterium]|nr:hypothetical protein [Sandaracinaceae bacterium]